jgi:hypothetical protein
MKILLTAVCLAVLALMLFISIAASLQQDIISANRQLWLDPWYRVLLADAYCGFLFFWLWVAWREQSGLWGAFWFLLIMGLGNLGAALYLLLQLRRWQPADGVARLLLGNRRGTPSRR